MGTEQNKQVVRAFLDAVKNRQPEKLRAVLADDGQFWVMGAGTLDKAGFIGAIQVLWDVMEGPAPVEIHHMTAEDDRVSIVATGRMISKTGKPYENDYHMLAFVKGGQLAGWREYFNTHVAAEAFAG